MYVEGFFLFLHNIDTFQDFSQKLEMNLPQNILSQFETSFSFFIYNDNGKVRFGLAVNSKDGNQLKSALLKEEKNLTRNPKLETQSLISTYAFARRSFSHSWNFFSASSWLISSRILD